MIRNEAALDEMLQTMTRFVSERLVPNEERVDREGVIPEDIVAEMRSLGLGGLSLPEAYGGVGLTVEEKIRVAIAVGWTSPAYYRRLSTNDGAGFALVAAGTEAQKREWLSRLASGAVTGSFAMTEPGAGSDAASIRTSARRDGDSYVLNGTKRFITNAPYADLFLVTARTDPSKAGAKGISTFLVEADRPGLSRTRADRKMGLHGNDTGDVILDDCRIPAANLVGEEGEGFRIVMKRLDIVRVEAAAVAVGNAERLIDESLRYAAGRVQFGRPIADYQLIQAMLADCRAEAYAARSMVIDAARRLDDGRVASTEAACCKLFATEMVGRVADRAVQIQGGSGYMRGTCVERFYRDVRVYRIYDGTNQIQQLLIARNMLREAG
ncbi:MAG: acyl-CoA dehydrogenase family protein [Alphaproteobacteria bacterium]|jgi:acyl-CoA dehydrogenase|nr:acyl-CoA dehydrogenase family protein [Alphaproteobacteria bacterium]